MIENSKLIHTLNGWPVGTNGYSSDEKLITTLLQLMKEHGNGHVAQLANAIQEISVNPTAINDWIEFRNQRMVLLGVKDTI